jgi:hypothetical protein
MVPSEVRKLNFNAPTFDYNSMVRGMQTVKSPGLTNGKLIATARGTQTSPSVASMDVAHKSSPGDFPSPNVNKLEEAHEDTTTEASEAGSDHNQY